MGKKKENTEETNDNTSSSREKTKKIGRRDLLKGLATVPVIGAIAYGSYRKKHLDHLRSTQLVRELDLSHEAPVLASRNSVGGERLRLGIIGYGGRGSHLVRSTGYAHPDFIERMREAAKIDPGDKRYEDYLNQEDLNVEFRGICDVFDIRAERAMAATGNFEREGKEAKLTNPAKRYRTYQELLAADDIDAVIIATPDHWHSKIAIDAAKAGKHVYVEKGMTRTIEETYELLRTVKETGITFQLGHQGRQTESYLKAREAIEKNVLGKISLIQVNTNRNSPNGAWVYDIHPEASPGTIDWKQFIGPAPWHPFSVERFFRWRCWWDYGTGLAGDLLTHEYDAINQVMDLGIPDSVSASGGIYYYKDGREVPDVYQATHEYKDRDLTLLYSATLASDKYRGSFIMGHDAYMELGGHLYIYADPESTRYREQIKSGIIDPSAPIYSYIPGRNNVDAVSTATEKYFANRGLLYTYREGKRVDTTHLHVKEWLDAIRTGTQPSCNIDQGFQEAITAHMGTLSYKEKKTVFWDKEKQKVVI